MKWSNRRYELNDIYQSLTSNENSIFIWGAGNLGNYLSEIIHGDNCKIELAGFIDNDEDKQNKVMQQNKLVYPPSVLMKDNRNKIIILSVIDKASEIEGQIAKMGLNEICKIINFKSFMTLYYYYFKNSTYIQNIIFSVTQKCSLNCKYCSVLTPHIKGKEHYSLEALKQDADIYFNSVDFTGSVTIVGGEPFIYPWLDTFIEYIMEKYANQIGQKWIIITNGTIIPRDNLLNLIKKYNGCIEISDYSDAIPNIKKNVLALIEKLKTENVNYSVYAVDHWIDFGYFDQRETDDSEEKLRNLFDSCNMPCRLTQNGKIYYCANSLFATYAGINDEDESNIYDLSKLDKNNSKDLMEFDMGYNQKGYINMCKKCNGYLTVNHNYIKVAEQLLPIDEGNIYEMEK